MSSTATATVRTARTAVALIVSSLLALVRNRSHAGAGARDQWTQPPASGRHPSIASWPRKYANPTTTAAPITTLTQPL